MPYIKPEDRPRIDAHIQALLDEVKDYSSGELNYTLTRIVRAWMGSIRYHNIAVATGVLENVKQEIYRRVAGPYEDAKILENGDVN